MSQTEKKDFSSLPLGYSFFHVCQYQLRLISRTKLALNIYQKYIKNVIYEATLPI